MFDPKLLKAVIFDLDDTLYPESQFVLSGFNAVDKYLSDHDRCKEGQFAGTAWSLFERGLRGRIFDETLRLLGLESTATTVRDLIEVYRSHHPVIAMFPDGSDCLEALSKRFRLGVITDGPAACQRNKFQALFLAQWVDQVVYSDECGRDCWKPHPKPYKTIQERLGLEPFSLVYVGDNPAKDFRGARGVGWRSIRIRRPGTLHFEVEPLPGYEPDLEFPSLKAMKAALLHPSLPEPSAPSETPPPTLA